MNILEKQNIIVAENTFDVLSLSDAQKLAGVWMGEVRNSRFMRWEKNEHELYLALSIDFINGKFHGDYFEYALNKEITGHTVWEEDRLVKVVV